MNKFLQKMDNLRRQIHDDKVNIHDTDMAYKRSKGDGLTWPTRDLKVMV